MRVGISNRQYQPLLDSHCTRLVVRVHLVKLVNAAYAIVSEHQGACLDAKLARLFVFAHLQRGRSQGGNGWGRMGKRSRSVPDAAVSIGW
jgi:hypothetical protein